MDSTKLINPQAYGQHDYQDHKDHKDYQDHKDHHQQDQTSKQQNSAQDLSDQDIYEEYPSIDKSLLTQPKWKGIAKNTETNSGIKRFNQFNITDYNSEDDYQFSPPDYSRNSQSSSFVDNHHGSHISKPARSSSTRFYMSAARFNNYLGFVFDESLGGNIFSMNVPLEPFNILNSSTKKPSKKDRQGICFAFLFGRCNKNPNDCSYNHPILNPAAWNFLVVASLLRSENIWINSCKTEKNNINKNTIDYNNVFKEGGCSFWHEEYLNRDQSHADCKHGLNCRDLTCHFYHSSMTRQFFPEVIAFLKSYTVDPRDKYAVSYSDKSLYRDEPVAPKPKVMPQQQSQSQDARFSRPTTPNAQSGYSPQSGHSMQSMQSTPSPNNIVSSGSTYVTPTKTSILPDYNLPQSADSIIYSLRNEVDKLKLEKSKLENERKCQIMNYKQLEDVYKKQSQLCLDLSKQLETLRLEADFKNSASMRQRGPFGK